MFGFSVSSQTLAKAKPVPQGVISGKVLIANTDSILMATITMPGYLMDSTGQAKPIMQKMDGSFSITVPPGTYRMRVAAGDSFLWQEQPGDRDRRPDGDAGLPRQAQGIPQGQPSPENGG